MAQIAFVSSLALLLWGGIANSPVISFISLAVLIAGTILAVKNPLGNSISNALFISFLTLAVVVSFTYKGVLAPLAAFLGAGFLLLMPSKPEEKKEKTEEEVTESTEELEEILMESLTPEEFSKLIEDLIKGMGGKDVKILEISDTGVDMKATLEDRSYVILARRYKGTISMKLLRRLFERMLEEGADRGMFITTSTFSQNAYRFVEGKPVDMIDGKELKKLLRYHLKVNLVI